MLRWLLAVSTIFFISFQALSQTPTATINGRILDPSRAVISGATVEAINVNTNAKYRTQTDASGLFTIRNLPPGDYRLEASKPGFRTIVKPSLVLHVQDVIALNFDMSVGSTLETVTVTGGAPLVNTEDAAVSTVVDRNFAENLPMNGRSFQTLIQLTPGVVTVPSGTADSGQFSVNGQRAVSNYWMLDGVGANIGIGVNTVSNPGNGLSGALGSFSVLGGTNSLVSVDAMQEFRIQTSTYAPEFGRTPGAQISIVSRSGTNQFHGTLFDYLRNDVFDANNWFNGFTNDPPLPKAREHQNDFGGTLAGPIWKDKTFFFLSYEGLRLRLPQTTLSTVPDEAARQSAPAEIQPFLKAFPSPNGQDNTATGEAQFNASYSNPASLDAYSLRIDHRLSDKLTLFGRYNYSPSKLVQRGSSVDALSALNNSRIAIRTLTLGTTTLLSALSSNDFRFNYSQSDASTRESLDDFGGAVPLSTLPFPAGFSTNNALFAYRIRSLQQGVIRIGDLQKNRQRQFNIVDSQSIQAGPHAIKFGIDFRRLSPAFDPERYSQLAVFRDVPSAVNGTTNFSALADNVSATFLFRDLGMYAQDTWHAWPNLVVTYGLRWDVNFTPTVIDGPALSTVNNFNLADLSNLALAPPGTRAYATKYANFAPRFGVAYQLNSSSTWNTVLRGGFGVFYDLASSEVGNQIFAGGYPFGASASSSSTTFPFPPSATAPPAIMPPGPTSGELDGFDPNLRLPYTLEWNVAVEQALGKQETISASYLGAAGRRLLQTMQVFSPNPNYQFAQLVVNGSTSDYSALQLQFQRRLSQGLQALASYAWSHSIDTASAGSFANLANLFVPGNRLNRASSDFDIRHAFSVGVTYNVPTPKSNPFAKTILGGWSLESIAQARSAPPADVSDFNFFQTNSGVILDVRPDRVLGQPLYVVGRQFPGGKAFNSAAFVDPPGDPNTGVPVRQGDLGRNALRGFGAVQWDCAVHRDFPIHESFKLQLRAEAFNVLNHPNFGQPNGTFGIGGFGVSSQMLAQSLNAGNLAGGAFNSLYQIGGPRSIQLALKALF